MITEKIIKRRLAIIILTYLFLFGIVISLTRSPDYFSGVVIKGTIDTFETKLVNPYKGSRFESRPFPVIRYYPNGSDQEHYTAVDQNFYLRSLKVGDSVKVIYNPDRPEVASFYSFPYYWFGPIELWAGAFILAFILIILATQKFI